ncbi:MAG: hypothetical protein CL681_21795 [Blastopirellula sp.]|nr:hypothetical protein [Blastopirellula sp.]
MMRALLSVCSSPLLFDRLFWSLVVASLLPIIADSLSAEETRALTLPDGVQTFLRRQCYDCHQGSTAEAGLDLLKLKTTLGDGVSERRWVRILDRVAAGEMPPRDSEQPPESVRASFLSDMTEWIRTQQQTRFRERGRVQARRLTRIQVERSLHDLLGIDIPLADKLPEDARSHGFTTVADGQAMSHFQLQRHLAVVDLALDEAFRRALTGPDDYTREFDARGIARRNPRRRCREPEMLDDQAVVWNGTVTFYGRLPATTAPVDGWYQFEITVAALKPPESGGVWSTVRTGLCVSSAPLLTHVKSFEATAQPRTIAFQAWLPQGHMLEVRPGDATLKRARFSGGQIGAGEGEPQDVPGIAMSRLVMKRVHRDGGDQAIRRMLFGDLKVAATGKREGRLQSSAPQEDVRRLLVAFARRAFRQPTTQQEIAPYIDQVLAAMDAGDDLISALRLGYRALLCSPRFLYFNETPGQLNQHQVAARLSYLLTGSTPDAQLSALADAGKLLERTRLKRETDRLLEQHGRQFVEDFAAEWLDLDQIDFTVPDRKLFPQFDPVVQRAMLGETHAFLSDLLARNGSVTRLIDADYTFLNSRLARYYDIPDVMGDELRRVALGAETRRGGVLTQGAILKVTANGSNTSPVVRGVWVSERLLGLPILPPPDNVPAIEPDIRGTTTIREQLAKHRSQASCANCHVKIDPPGFALENYDPAGQWRDRYLQSVRGRRRKGAQVDASYALPDGRKFEGIDGFQRLIVKQPRRLAANVAEKLLVYGCGAPMAFADRQYVEKIVEDVAEDDYGLRSIVHAVVTSPVFLMK